MFPVSGLRELRQVGVEGDGDGVEDIEVLEAGNGEGGSLDDLLHWVGALEESLVLLPLVTMSWTWRKTYPRIIGV